MYRRTVGLLVLGLGLALVRAPAADASGARIVVGGAPQHHTQRHFTQRHFSTQGRVFTRDPVLGVFRDPRQSLTVQRHHFDRRHRSKVIVVPRTVFVAPSIHCFVPGQWTYQWVPQTSWYNAWVPGHWSPDGTWIEGQYLLQPYTTGYYQPLWIPDRWAC